MGGRGGAGRGAVGVGPREPEERPAIDCSTEERALITDVIRSGNADLAWGLAIGDKVDLKLARDGTSTAEVLVDDTVIGWITSERIVECMNQGWQYEGTIVDKQGTRALPRISILVSPIASPGGSLSRP